MKNNCHNLYTVIYLRGNRIARGAEMLRGVYEKTHDPEPDLDNANVGMLTEHIGLMWPLL